MVCGVVFLVVYVFFFLFCFVPPLLLVSVYSNTEEIGFVQERGRGKIGWIVRVAHQKVG